MANLRRNDERGQVMPILLVTFVAVLAVGLVLFQVGSATDAKAQAQTAADSGAIAGAKSIGAVLERRLNGLAGPLVAVTLASLLSGVSGEGAARTYAEANNATLPPGGFAVILGPRLDRASGAIVVTVEASVTSNAAVPPPKLGPPGQTANGAAAFDAGTGQQATATAWAELELLPSGGAFITSVPVTTTTVPVTTTTTPGSVTVAVTTTIAVPPPTLTVRGRTRLVPAPPGFLPLTIG